ncbi:protein PLASTID TRANSCRIPTIONALLY ACTIVE 12, chloroplastic [Andrographis paniculata]|uniref:protein PLASTID TRANSCRIPTIONALLY ACTIVE 12, chloroplastic n=1 Tax=Andrographis paniculata TaxID=175694 RepID=UPI0021E91AE2|nr:protein PLASTID TRANSCRIPTIONALLY ACTIVE 12, chloroplastic [Andrographis paniculata]
MATVSPTWHYQDGALRHMVSVDCVVPNKFFANYTKVSFAGQFPLPITKFTVGSRTLHKRIPLPLVIKCEKKDKENSYEQVSVERYPYHVYYDSTSGQLEPASGARASIPSEEYWPEGTSNLVRAARAPEPTGMSTGKPSFGKNPGSRRKYKPKAAASGSSEMNVVENDPVQAESPDESSDEAKDHLSEYVVYQTETGEEELTGYELDKAIGNPHPFVDPKTKKPMDEPLTSEELWWNWRKPAQEQWSRWQRRRPDVETVFLNAMAKTGQIKLYGDQPTQTECALYRARRQIYKDERLQLEQEKLEEIGPIAYYSEWVKAWKRDTSREAIQKHFEETGEDENAQLIEMFTYQTDREYRIMMGTDIRICRDPLAMRMPEDEIKQIWGGDPVYPTVNYIQDPNEVIDFRGPDFHEPTPNMLDYLKEHGKIISREELEKTLAKEKNEELEMTDMDEAMARAVDIGENDDEGEDSEADGDEEEDGKIRRNWSAFKSNRALPNKSKNKPTKNGMTLDEAIDDSENLTDFLMDFDDQEE